MSFIPLSVKKKASLSSLSSKISGIYLPNAETELILELFESSWKDLYYKSKKNSQYLLHLKIQLIISILFKKKSQMSDFLNLKRSTKRFTLIEAELWLSKTTFWKVSVPPINSKDIFKSFKISLRPTLYLPLVGRCD